VFVIRLAYMIWLSPVQLVGDEAYYWEQGRHLDWSYNEKGPVLPWLVAASCGMFGHTEWAVRLPVLLSFVVAGWGVGRLATEVACGDQRVGFFAVVCFVLLPAFQANAEICTQDAPLIALWVALTATGLRLMRRWRRGDPTWGDWLVFWAVLGFSVLLKQSAILFLVGVGIYWLLSRRSLPLGRTFFLQQLAGVLAFSLVVSPIVIWNHRHGWPMLSHTLGHLGAGGDQAGQIHKGNPLTWLLSVLGGIAGAFGPACLILMFWASRRARAERARDESLWQDRLWLLCASIPSVGFFVLLSLTKPVIASWPLPSFVPLVVLVAELAVVEFSREVIPVAAGAASGSGVEPDGIQPRASSVGFRALWRFLVVYGLIAWAVMAYPIPLGHLPLVGKQFQKSLLKRITGHREAAQDLRAVLATTATPDGRPPVVVTRHYMQAALFAFYLPGHPVIRTADRYVGKRSTTFDQWEDTRLDNPQLLGRSLLLVEVQGNVARRDAKILANVTVPWDRALRFDELKPIDGGRYSLATNYQGPRPDNPASGGGGTDE
jgi:hypothetical protein